jgi:hypothetical protein
VVVEETT